MLKAYFAYSGTAHNDEDSTDEPIMTAVGDPYDIILASGQIMPLEISLTSLRTPFQLSRTCPWRT